MKKINLILMILAAAAGFTNCTKAELVDNKEAENGGTVVYATTDAATKTTLSDDYNVLWSTGDQIKFVKDDATGLTYTFTLDTGSGSSSGTFKCTEAPSDGTYTVYYPASYDGTNWPEQTYVSATDISGAPMKATATVSGGTVSDISFKNEGGILRYTVKGSKTIKSINVKSASLDLDVTLDCGTSGVALTSEGTVFNFALPAGEYSYATLTFTATDNTIAKKTASSFKVTKNVISLVTFESSNLDFGPPSAPSGFVDLGVTDVFGKPLYWAKCNLGATNPEDYGYYYFWGGTTGYTYNNSKWVEAGTTTERSGGFIQSNAPFYSSGYTKYNSSDSKTVLEKEDDAATQADPYQYWRTPTSNEFQSLKDNCYWEWTDNYNNTGVKGVIVYKANAPEDKGKYGGVSGYTISEDKYIFFPAAGGGWGTDLCASEYGLYWSSSLNSNNANNAYYLSFSLGDVTPQDHHDRYLGFSVRPVTTEAVACVAAGTMITMGDGSQKAVEKLEVGDVVRTVDHKTGQVSSAPVCFVWETKDMTNAFTLIFDGGKEVTIVQEHGFYNREERKYVFINANNAKDYIGQYFYDADNNRWLELKSCKLLDKAVDAYSVVTSKHLNHLADGMLSMCDGEEEILANIFEYDDHLKFDEAKKAADIAKYGLTPLEKILEYKGFTEDFYYDYNLMYLNVAIGKGLTTWDFVKALSDYYESYQID